MSKIALALYTLPAPIRSPLVKHPPDAVPPIEDLENLHAELKGLRQKAVERLKKAHEDARAIEESMRRMKDREREKKEVVKREREFTPIPPNKEKKKKRKREQFDEESDIELAKSLPPNPQPAPKMPPKPAPTISVKPPAHTAHPDFAVPPPSAQNPHGLIPSRPPVLVPPPGPGKPTDVMDDFSKLKVPSQIAISTFYTSIEPYVRALREEDVGWLEYSGEEEECFLIPGLGKHYKEIWDEVDHNLTHGLPPPPLNQTVPPPESLGAPEPTFDPSQLSDADTLAESRGHGPLTERVISALLPHPDAKLNWKGVKAAEDAMEGRPGGSGAAAARKEKMNVKEVEERVRDTMRFYELLDDIPSFDNPVSDPITTSLRIAQANLRSTLETNRARRAILIERAKERLAYQEYLEARDSIDKAILNTYTKLQRKDLPKPAKKKKKGEKAGSVAPSEVGEDGTPVPPVPTVPPAALGLVLDEDNRLVVPDSLKTLVNVRKELRTTIGSVFDSSPDGPEGKKQLLGGWRLPAASVFDEVKTQRDEMKMDVDVK